MDWGTHVVDMMLWYAGDMEWVMSQMDTIPIKKDPSGYRGGYFNVTPVMGYSKFKSRAVGFFETDLQPNGILGNSRIHIQGKKGESESRTFRFNG